MMSIGTAA
jgi:small nuclear ribonucleoprotein (snRNP)-like protein